MQDFRISARSTSCSWAYFPASNSLSPSLHSIVSHFPVALPRNLVLTKNIVVFDWNNKQNGALIGFIGIISALLQGGYVRRAIPKIGEGKMARRGVITCAIGLGLLSLVPHLVIDRASIAIRVLRAAAVCLAFTSATVVNSLTSYASLQCEDAIDPDTGKVIEGHPELAKGKALGKFRSSGQLGRAIGPILGKSPFRLSISGVLRHRKSSLPVDTD